MFIRNWANPSLAEELVQKTVFDAVKGRGSYDPLKGGPQEWLFGIAHNNIRMELRRRIGHPSVDGDITAYIEAIDTNPLPDEVLEKKDTAQLVRKAMDRLETKHRDVLRFMYIEDLPARDIAEKMDMTEKAVHSLLYRARLSLAQVLKQTAALNKE
jgi:RNA polymerase sigma-70 factor (ECF subfamily)